MSVGGTKKGATRTGPTRGAADGRTISPEERSMEGRKKIQVEELRRGDSKSVIYRLSGSLTDTHEGYQFLEQVRQAVADGFRLVVLNLSGMRHISSAGVGILAACYTSVKRNEGRMSLVDVPKQGETLLKLVMLWDLLGHHDTEEAALRALSS
ncbi:MAG: STAS domain-containing protein [Candidatus Eisenbacteria bacterium]|nr:STAS domain-containing protein [Candidatus Eisenbacteria bacterium]